MSASHFGIWVIEQHSVRECSIGWVFCSPGVYAWDWKGLNFKSPINGA